MKKLSSPSHQARAPKSPASSAASSAQSSSQALAPASASDSVSDLARRFDARLFFSPSQGAVESPVVSLLDATLQSLFGDVEQLHVAKYRSAALKQTIFAAAADVANQETASSTFDEWKNQLIISFKRTRLMQQVELTHPKIWFIGDEFISNSRLSSAMEILLFLVTGATNQRKTAIYPAAGLVTTPSFGPSSSSAPAALSSPAELRAKLCAIRDQLTEAASRMNKVLLIRMVDPALDDFRPSALDAMLKLTIQPPSLTRSLVLICATEGVYCFRNSPLLSAESQSASVVSSAVLQSQPAAAMAAASSASAQESEDERRAIKAIPEAPTVMLKRWTEVDALVDALEALCTGRSSQDDSTSEFKESDVAAANAWTESLDQAYQIVFGRSMMTEMQSEERLTLLPQFRLPTLVVVELGDIDTAMVQTNSDALMFDLNRCWSESCAMVQQGAVARPRACPQCCTAMFCSAKCQRHSTFHSPRGCNALAQLMNINIFSRMSVGVIPWVNFGGRWHFFCQQSISNKFGDLKCDPFRGYVAPYETLAQAGSRKVMEESNLLFRISPGSLSPDRVMFDSSLILLHVSVSLPADMDTHRDLARWFAQNERIIIEQAPDLVPKWSSVSGVWLLPFNSDWKGDARIGHPRLAGQLRSMILSIRNEYGARRFFDDLAAKPVARLRQSPSTALPGLHTLTDL